MSRFLQSLFVGLCVLYVFAGVQRVPFLGDEATTIAVSRDYHVLLHQFDPSSIFYTAGGANARSAALRLTLNAFAPFSSGFGWTLAGLPVESLNNEWDWGKTLEANQEAGNLPGSALLWAARLPQAWLLALSVALCFVIARRLGGVGVAVAATTIYASMPAVLLHGRRAMGEGALLFGLALVLLLSMEIARRLRDFPHDARGRLSDSWLMLGVAAGLALSANFNAAYTLVAVVVLLVWLSVRRFAILRANLAGLLGAGVLALITFLVFSPMWWSAPLRVARDTAQTRRDILANQVARVGALTGWERQSLALLALPFGKPQFFEADQPWDVWLGDAIPNYEQSGLAGFDWWRAGILVLCVLGVWLLVGRSERLMLGAVFVFNALALLYLNPLPWQRYYIPLVIPLALLGGAGLWTLVSSVIWIVARLLRRPGIVQRV